MMNKERTILEAIRIVCENMPKGMSINQIYQKITEKGLLKSYE